MDDLSGISAHTQNRFTANGVVIVSGAAATRSPAGALVEFAAAHLAAAGHAPATIVVRDLPTVALLTADRANQPPAVRAATTLIAQAAALVVVTPVYRAAHSGLVKSLLDLLPRGTLAGKTILPLATGSTQGQTFALDYALRPLLHALGATRVLVGHFLLDHQVQAATNTLTPPAAIPVMAALTTLTSTLPARLAPAS